MLNERNCMLLINYFKEFLVETQEIKKEQELNKTADKQTETQAQEGTHFEHVKETLELLFKTFP